MQNNDNTCSTNLNFTFYVNLVGDWVLQLVIYLLIYLFISSIHIDIKNIKTYDSSS